jgi:hypothetical protein
MNSVSLVCTVHEPMGLANASALLALLEHIQPEVIFLEVPPAAFDDYYGNCSQQNLESMAVRLYREGRQIELIPVDLPTPTGEFVSNFEELRRRIRQVSQEYRRLMKWDEDCIREYGFAYLNSEHCSELWSDVYKEMVSTIKWMNDDPRLVAIYEAWKQKNDLREREMIENIEKYCGENTFNRGVFLVGAAHRQAIIDIAREQSAVDSTRIQRDFGDWMSQVTRESGA